jgi:hypothetical protein
MRPWSLLGVTGFWLALACAKDFVARAREVAAREWRNARRVGGFVGPTDREGHI